MSTFINTVDSVGDEALTNSIIDRSITELADNISTTIGQNAFRACKALTSVNFPNVTSTGTAAFYQCTALKKADFGSCVAFGNNTFYGCSALAALILRNTEAVSSLTGNLSGTPIASGTGYIYVPSALVATYKAATGWSTYADQIRALEDYPEFDDPYTWDGVFSAINHGNYASVYSVGDLVPLDLGSEGVVNMQIAGIDVDDKADGSGKAPISWISKELLATMHRTNPEVVSNADGTYQEGTGMIGGWVKSEMRTYLNDTILPLIPEDVRTVIKPVTKYSDIYDTSGAAIDGEASEDSVWVPSAREMIGGTKYETVGAEYTGLFKSNADRIKKTVGGTQLNTWILRTAMNKSVACVVSTGGAVSTSAGASITYPIALGFCT